MIAYSVVNGERTLLYINIEQCKLVNMSRQLCNHLISLMVLLRAGARLVPECVR